MLNIISLGAGVQSSTMALMAAHGEIKPMPDCAIFADTGWEGEETYKQVQWLSSVLPFPVHVVSAGNIHTDHQINYSTRTTMPLRLNDGINKSRAMQKCTHDYKTVPNERRMKEILRGSGVCGRILPTFPAITQWRGITTDEAHRMKPASEPWYQTRFPLIMDVSFSRGHCVEWLLRHSYSVPQRSSCIGCPNHGNQEWRAIKGRSVEWEQAVSLDKLIRKAGGLDAPAFLHSDGVPLDEADLSTDSTIDMFGNECEGMCGV